MNSIDPDLTLDIFMLFFAINWGFTANVQGRWKAFQWPFLFYRRPPSWRLLLSLILLNLGPIAFFCWTIQRLGEVTTAQDLWVNVLRGILPSFAPFGFYRVWIGVVEIKPNWFYRSETEGVSNRVDPTIRCLGIDKRFGKSNIIFGVMYLVIALLVPIFR